MGLGEVVSTARTPSRTQSTSDLAKALSTQYPLLLFCSLEARLNRYLRSIDCVCHACFCSWGFELSVYLNNVYCKGAVTYNVHVAAVNKPHGLCAVSFISK
jgi:hypothetical protein